MHSQPGNLGNRRNTAAKPARLGQIYHTPAAASTTESRQTQTVNVSTCSTSELYFSLSSCCNWFSLTCFSHVFSGCFFFFFFNMDFYINYISIYRGVFRNFPLFIKTLPSEILIWILVRVPSSKCQEKANSKVCAISSLEDLCRDHHIRQQKLFRALI